MERGKQTSKETSAENPCIKCSKHLSMQANMIKIERDPSSTNNLSCNLCLVTGTTLPSSVLSIEQIQNMSDSEIIKNWMTTDSKLLEEFEIALQSLKSLDGLHDRVDKFFDSILEEFLKTIKLSKVIFQNKVTESQNSAKKIIESYNKMSRKSELKQLFGPLNQQISKIDQNQLVQRFQKIAAEVMNEEQQKLNRNFISNSLDHLKSVIKAVGEKKIESTRESITCSIRNCFNNFDFLKEQVTLSPTEQFEKKCNLNDLPFQQLSGKTKSKRRSNSKFSFQNGIKVYEDGRKYIGNFVNELLEGDGQKENSLRIQRGNFHEGQLQGFGEDIFKDNGLQYIGEFQQGKYCGIGKLTYPVEVGGFYEGEFANDLPNGFGRLVKADGEQYIGFFENGNYHGKGVMFYKNNEYHLGTFQMNQIHGKGRRFFNDQFYQGYFSSSNYQGLRMFLSSDGTQFNIND